MCRPHATVVRVAALLPLATALGGCRPGPLPARDQIAIYQLALRQVADRYQPAGQPIQLLLSPLPVPLVRSDTGRIAHYTLPPLDTMVVRALVAGGAVAGLCAPAASDRECANGQRGLTARLSAIERLTRDSVRVSVETQGMRAVGDRTVLIDGPVHESFAFVRINGRWQRPPRAPVRPA